MYWAKITPAEAGLDVARLEEARDYALTGGGSDCMRADGCTVHLVFSGDDQFSVRRGTVKLREGMNRGKKVHPSGE